MSRFLTFMGILNNSVWFSKTLPTILFNNLQWL